MYSFIVGLYHLMNAGIWFCWE